MSDNSTGLNAQYASPPFGAQGNYLSTGADGTPSNPGASYGAPVGSPAVVPVYQTSQGPIGHVTVLAGDTTGMSSDSVIPAGGDPLTGLTVSQVTETGAGRGTVCGPPHPTAGGGA